MCSVCKQVVHSEVSVYSESRKKEVKHDWYYFWFLCHTGNGRSGAWWDTLFNEVCSVVILSIWVNILSSFDMHTYYLHTMHNVRDGCCSNSRALWKQSRSQLSGLDRLRMLGLYDKSPSALVQFCVWCSCQRRYRRETPDCSGSISQEIANSP